MLALRRAMLAACILAAAGATRGPAAASAQQPALPPFTPADVRFMQDMIAHHAQALEMAALVPERVASDEVRNLAVRIDISQRDEIAMMQKWLADRGQDVPGEHAHHAPHAHAMPGMLTREEMARLADARGSAFDRLFLVLMIRHHEGAISMVDTLFASPRAGEDPEIFRFATDVAADQTDEIDVMRWMLELISTRGSR